MNKFELAYEVSEKTFLNRKEAETIINVVLDTIRESLSRQERVQLTGFGTFDVKQRAERIGRDLKNPEKTMKIPARKVPTFRASKRLKDAVSHDSSSDLS